jgi:hypothetical protein
LEQSGAGGRQCFAELEGRCVPVFEKGFRRVVEGEAAGQRFLYYRSKAAPGVILELLERTPSFEAMLKELQERSANYKPMPARAPVAASGKAAAKTMKAALLKDYGGPENFYLGEEPIPVPGKGEVRVRVAAAGVNPATLQMASAAAVVQPVEHEAATRSARPGCADVGSGHCLHELLCRGRYIRRVEDEHIHYARTQGAQQVHLHRHDASPVGGTGGRSCAVRVTIDVARKQRRVGKQAAEVGDHAPTARTYLDTQSGAAT